MAHAGCHPARESAERPVIQGRRPGLRCAARLFLTVFVGRVTVDGVIVAVLVSQGALD